MKYAINQQQRWLFVVQMYCHTCYLIICERRQTQPEREREKGEAESISLRGGVNADLSWPTGLIFRGIE